jgi:hypothetical protein
LPKKKCCFVILGQNVLAKSVVVNELLSRYILPFQITSNLDDENWRLIRIKYGKTHCYTYHLVESDFELMSTEQINKKFSFSQNIPSGSSKSSANMPTQAINTSPISIANPLLTSQAPNFSIPIEDLRLDNDLVQAHRRMSNARDEAELNDLKEKLKRCESIAENQAILEINLDHKLLEQNVEILVHSKHMPKSIFDKLMHNILPIYVYGIIESKLSPEVSFRCKKNQ